jgi:hypothetical protein
MRNVGWAIPAMREKADNTATEAQSHREIPCYLGKKRQSNGAEYRTKNTEQAGCGAGLLAIASCLSSPAA